MLVQKIIHHKKLSVLIVILICICTVFLIYFEPTNTVTSLYDFPFHLQSAYTYSNST